MPEIRFLFPDEVIRIHINQIAQFGGTFGVRDYGLLHSAVYEPQASFGGSYLYQNIFNMSAAYAYSIIKNHPFVDGNKRTGTLSALIFLEYNGYESIPDQNQLYKFAISIATSKISIEEAAAFLKKHSTMH